MNRASELPETMTAAVTLRHGGPEALEVRRDWPVPRPRAGEVLVRVAAAAVNNTDLWSRRGAYGRPGDPDAVAGWKGVPLRFPLIQGIDIAGTVVEVGDGVDDDWVGRRVIVDPAARYEDGVPADITGSEIDGGFAEFHRCAVAQCHDVGGSQLSDAQLACLPTAYGTAMGMINRAGCREGERVVVTGSSGGVGSAAIQLLVGRGCRVIAYTSASKADLVRSWGPAEIVVRSPTALASVDPVDAVVDVVGGDEFGGLVDRLRTGGRLVTAGAIAGPVVSLDLRQLYLQQRRIIGSTMHTAGDFADLVAMAAATGVAPVVAATYPLEEIGAAQERFEAKDFTGKLVLIP
jgi:NADPH:quinone reductase-like Zn-dependent oxidoreductase